MTDTTAQAGEVQTGVCECGAEVSRRVPADAFAIFVRRMPFVCGACITKAEESDREREREFEQDAAIRRLQRRQSQSGIPASLSGLVLEGQAATPPLLEARRWLDELVADGKRGLLLTGPVGVGKTHLAAQVAGEMLQRGGSLRWLTGPLMFARLGSGLGTPERDAVLEILTGRRALFLDDLDKTRPTAYGAEHVFLAVDGRVTEGVPLIVTTNLTLAELCELWPDPYGEAIASRLAGYCRIVHMDGPDRRIG